MFYIILKNYYIVYWVNGHYGFKMGVPFSRPSILTKWERDQSITHDYEDYGVAFKRLHVIKKLGCKIYLGSFCFPILLWGWLKQQ